MRGLTDDERWTLNRCDVTVERATTHTNRVKSEPVTQWRDAVISRLQKRRLISDWFVVDNGLAHTVVTTPLGRLALQLDTAARNLSVDKDWCP